MKLNKSIIVCIGILMITQVHAQEIYRTKNGDMLITAISSNDSVLRVTTKKLSVTMNYESAEFEMSMDKSDFSTGIDSIDKKLALMKFEIIEFKGKLDIDRINRDGHSPLDFYVEGILSTNNNTIRGTGHLEHISNRGTFSCLLTLKFNLKTDELGLNVDDFNLKLKDDIQIDITQTVLNKTEDQ